MCKDDQSSTQRLVGKFRRHQTIYYDYSHYKVFDIEMNPRAD